jgi:hypothetical protein
MEMMSTQRTGKTKPGSTPLLSGDEAFGDRSSQGRDQELQFDQYEELDRIEIDLDSRLQDSLPKAGRQQ